MSLLLMMARSRINHPPAPTVYATWNPADKDTSILLTNANVRAYQGAVTKSATVRSTAPCVGKAYFEQLLSVGSAAGEVIGTGLADATTILATYPGSTSLGVSAWQPSGKLYFNGVGTAYASLPGHSSTVVRYEFAVDVATRKVWMREHGGAWAGGGDPTLGTTPTCTLAGTGGIYAAATPFMGSAPSQYIDLVSDPANMTGTVPSGFTAGL